MVKVSVPFWARIASMVPLTSMARRREPNVTTDAGRCNTSLFPLVGTARCAVRDTIIGSGPPAPDAAARRPDHLRALGHDKLELLLLRARHRGNSRQGTT